MSPTMNEICEDFIPSMPKYIKTNDVTVWNEGKLTVETQEKLNLLNIIRTERIQFTISGMYPLHTDNKLRLFLQNVQLLIVAIFSSILAISMIIQLIKGVDKLSEITSILYYLITQATYIFKLINFLVNRNKLFDIEVLLDDDITHRFYRIFGHVGLDDIVKACWVIGLTFRICAGFTLSFYILTPLVSEDILLPFSGWMPVDKEEYWTIIFITQISCFFVSCFTNLSLDLFAAFYFSIAVGEQRLLKVCLSNLDYTLGDDGTRSVVFKNRAESMNMDVDEDKIPKIPASSLREVVVLHKHVILLIETIEAMFSNGIFVQFLASVATICLSGFNMLVATPGGMEFFMVFCYFLCMLYQVIMYCWFGNEILVESEGINDALYLSNWYEAEPKYKKVLFLIMERAKRPNYITAGKLFVLSLTTLVVIGKTSYSYFAVLQRLYSDGVE